MKFYLLIIISSYLFPFEILDDSMNINYSPLSVESSAMGGVYRPFNADKKIIFSHLSKFGGIYTLDIIKYNYKQNNIIFTSHGVDDITNTTQAWQNIDNDGPAANEIDYSKINYFNIKDFNLIISRIIKNKYSLSIKSTFSKNYNEYGFGLGINIVTVKKEFKNLDYYLGVWDFISFKRWSTSSFEYYKPKLMISFEYPILKSLNILTLYIDDRLLENIINYKVGSKISLTDNFNIYFGNSNLDKLSIGFSIINELFNIDYSYMMSNDNVLFDNSYNIGIGINISKLAERAEDFYP